MRTYLSSVVLLLIIFCAGCYKDDITSAGSISNILNAQQQSTPNIIIILADDIGYEIPTYSGGESYSTPNLDNLAANGTQFAQAHAAPLCSPSRFMLLTGKYNFRNYTTWGSMDTAQRTFANLARRAGYATCMAGKWQFDGGDASIHAFGFEKYLVTNPFNVDVADDGELKFYKNPQIYENGAYWPGSATKGKYGDDIIRDYMFSFIDSVKGKKPFLIYWATNLVHAPFCPTPDDPEFAAWSPNKPKQAGDTIYFPSMVKYEDKLIGQLVQKLRNAKIEKNTIIMWLGDNGTPAGIHSLYKGKVVGGAKSSSTEAGTHVPMLAYCPGKVLPGIIDTSLISLVDFMPAVSNIAKSKIPLAWGTIDGIDFTPQFQGDYSNLRPWIFCHFLGSGANEDNPQNLRRWMQDDTFKQYDSLPNSSFSKKFYNIRKDPEQKFPIPQSLMTTHQREISKQYLENMKQLH